MNRKSRKDVEFRELERSMDPARSKFIRMRQISGPRKKEGPRAKKVKSLIQSFIEIPGKEKRSGRKGSRLFSECDGFQMSVRYRLYVYPWVCLSICLPLKVGLKNTIEK